MNVHRTHAEVGGIPNLPATMTAVQQDRYGHAGVLRVGRRPVPEPTPDRVLVRVRRCALNPLDWHMMTGLPWFLRLVEGLRRPRQPVRGVDLAGDVVAVGADVEGIAVGDRVFGGGPGALADYAACKPSALAAMPASMSYDEGAALPVAAVTALQGLRDHGGVTAGSSVLINGAAGGVGTCAVQIAKHLGADVTAVCSTRNVEMVRELGADRVVDYTTDDVVALGRRFDAILDNVGNRSLGDLRRLLTDDGVLVSVSGPKRNRVWGPVGRMIAAKLRFLIGSQRAVSFTAKETHDELVELVGLVEAGALHPQIERVIPLADAPAAIDEIGEGHVRAKIVVDVAGHTP